MLGRLVNHVSPSEKKEGKLTAEETEEIVQMFKLCDVNGDGSVTKPELKEALWSLGQHPSEEEMENIFCDHDVDQTGTLNFNEFKSLMAARLTYKNTREEFEEAFQAIDHNKDGKLDVGELNRLMVTTEFDGLTNQELHDLFGVFDKDGSGKVDLEEFMDYMMGV